MLTSKYDVYSKREQGRAEEGGCCDGSVNMTAITGMADDDHAQRHAMALALILREQV